MTAFNERFRELRKKKGLSQRELANVLHMSNSTVAMYETGKRQPDFESLEKIADFFNVDIDYLLGRKDTTHRIVEVHPEYYENETVRAITDRLRTNPEYGLLFKAAADLKPEDIELVQKFIERMSD
jgi:transcriptional regulator with XRE-family HTH domain